MTQDERRRHRDRRLLEAMARHGIVDPLTTLRVARRVNRWHGHMPLSRACALLEKESRGGENIWGDLSDRHGRVPPSDGAVTRENYAAYLKRRDTNGRQQGCGPTQLTFFTFQDEADSLGGCWRPSVNMYVGFSHLARNIGMNGVAGGTKAYNGSLPEAGAYALDLLAREARWLRILQAALSKEREPQPAPPRSPAAPVRPLRPSGRAAPANGGPPPAEARQAVDANLEVLVRRLVELSGADHRVRPARAERNGELEKEAIRRRKRRRRAAAHLRLAGDVGPGALAEVAQATTRGRQGEG